MNLNLSKWGFLLENVTIVIFPSIKPVSTDGSLITGSANYTAESQREMSSIFSKTNEFLIKMAG